jgi:hypothetical protein
MHNTYAWTHRMREHWCQDSNAFLVSKYYWSKQQIKHYHIVALNNFKNKILDQ